MEFHVFDPDDDVAIIERKLPHWSQTGTISFITWRTWDSIPANVLEQWLAERDKWLRRNFIDPAGDWRFDLAKRPELAREYLIRFGERWNDLLDDCHEACPFRDPVLAKIVAGSLKRFDGDRYDLTDYVVMPNHVHLLAAFADENAMLAQCESWKHYTAGQVNRSLGRKGRFWQKDGFDHLVRSEKQFEHLRKYIAENPVRAQLRDGEFVWESKNVKLRK